MVENALVSHHAVLGNEEVDVDSNKSAQLLEKVEEPAVQDTAGEEEWSVVSPGKGCRSDEKLQSPSLCFEESRYSVLSDQEDNGYGGYKCFRDSSKTSFR